jgi:hypothetical protein
MNACGGLSSQSRLDPGKKVPLLPGSGLRERFRLS